MRRRATGAVPLRPGACGERGAARNTFEPQRWSASHLTGATCRRPPRYAVQLEPKWRRAAAAEDDDANDNDNHNDNNISPGGWAQHRVKVGPLGLANYAEKTSSL